MKTYNTSAFKVTFKKKMSASMREAFLAVVEELTPGVLEEVNRRMIESFTRGASVLQLPIKIGKLNGLYPKIKHSEEYKKQRAKNMRLFGPSSKPQWGPRQIKKMQGRKPLLFNKISKIIEKIYPKAYKVTPAFHTRKKK